MRKEIPKLPTLDSARQKLKDDGYDTMGIISERMFGSLKGLQEYSDSDNIARLAIQDINNMDFIKIKEYITNLCVLVDYYKERAEDYLFYLDENNFKLDTKGYIQEI